MKYICLVYQDEGKLNSISDVELAEEMSNCGAWVEGLEKRGQHIYSAALQSVRTAITLRSTNGKLSTTDGPFAETREFLGGFTILEARDLNEAIQLASKLPAARFATIEVRPVMGPDVELAEPLDRKIAAAIRNKR